MLFDELGKIFFTGRYKAMFTLRTACHLLEKRRADLGPKIAAFREDLGDLLDADVFSLLYSIYWGNEYFERTISDGLLHEIAWHILTLSEAVSPLLRDDWFKNHYLVLLGRCASAARRKAPVPVMYACT
jgi:hypothetical protein